MSSITYKDVPYYVAGQAGSKVGIIVIQEWWGLNQHIKNMTGRFATALNALAITPDLYRGKVATVADEANHLMGSLDWPNALVDIRNACEYLKSQGCTKIGITGFCMGGALTIASCVHIKEINAGSCFYGIPPVGFANPADLKTPIQFHFGDKDMSPGFNGKYEAVARQGSIAEFHRYIDGNHAFMNEEAPAYPHDPVICKLAMQHTVDFFNTYLV
ncbi:dienelactone hydrolase [Globomyces pollinis-pini]|nr:dienelactone hydrolase [Globomyces pollinis-pini]